jgi:hypothetical protein
LIVLSEISVLGVHSAPWSNARRIGPAYRYLTICVRTAYPLDDAIGVM